MSMSSMSHGNEFACPPAGGLPGEIAARIADFLARTGRGMAGSMPQRVESIRRLIKEIEEKVLTEGLREGLLGIVRRFRRELETGDAAGAISDAEWRALVERIEAYGRTTTIENYAEYIFSFEGMPRVGLD